MKLHLAIKQCRKCKELGNRINAVPGDGPVPCSIVFLGEAPGRTEDETGRPFCGYSGNVLEAAAFKAGLHRGKDYHILNVLKCRTPENRNPLPEELENCRPFLEQQLKVVQPKVVVAFGRFAQGFVLKKSAGRIRVLQSMGDIVQHPDYYAVLSCHPAYVSHNRQVLPALQRHVRMAKQIANGKVPKCAVTNVAS